MKLFLLCVVLAVTVAEPLSDTDKAAIELNMDLDDLLEQSRNVDKMGVKELKKLSEKVDSTMKRLEDLAGKELGISLNDLERYSTRIRREDPPAESTQSGYLMSLIQSVNGLINTVSSGVSSGVNTGMGAVGNVLNQLGSYLNSNTSPANTAEKPAALKEK